MIEENRKQSHVSSKLNYAVCFALFLRKNRFCVTQGFFVEFGVNNTVLFCIFFSPWLVLTLVLDPLSSNEWLFYEIMWKCRPLFPLNKTKLSTHVSHCSSPKCPFGFFVRRLSVTCEGVFDYDSFLKKMSCWLYKVDITWPRSCDMLVFPSVIVYS